MMDHITTSVKSEPGLTPIWDYLHQLRVDNKLCDIQLLIRTKHPLEEYVDDFAVADCIQAHKIILAASSQFFRRCLDKGELLNVYNFDGIQSKNMQVLVDYMYHQVSWNEVQANEEAAEVARVLEVIEHDETLNRIDYPKDLDGNRVLIVKMQDQNVQSNRTSKMGQKSKRVIVDNLEAEFLRHDIHGRHQKKVTKWENQLDSPLVINQFDQTAATSMLHAETVPDMQDVSDFVSDVSKSSSTGNMENTDPQQSLGSGIDHVISEVQQTKLIHSSNDSGQAGNSQGVVSTNVDVANAEVYPDELAEDKLDPTIIEKTETSGTAIEPSTVILVRNPKAAEVRSQNVKTPVKNEMANLDLQSSQFSSDNRRQSNSHTDMEHAPDVKDPSMNTSEHENQLMAPTKIVNSEARRYSTRFMGQKRIIEVLPRKVKRSRLEDGSTVEIREPLDRNLESNIDGQGVNVVNSNLKVVKLEKVNESQEKPSSGKEITSGSHTVTAASALPSLSERELHLTWNRGRNQCQQPSKKTRDAVSEICLINKSESSMEMTNQLGGSSTGVNSTSGLAPRKRGRPRKQPLQESVKDRTEVKDGAEVSSSFQCRFCGKTFKNCTGLSIHEQWKHGAADAVGHKKEITQKTYTCDSCNKVCACFQALVQHMRCIHNKTPTHKCKECDIEFNTKRAYNAHMVREHNTSLYRCKLCQTTFKSPEGYKIHMFKKHTEAENAFECSKCGKTFKMKHELAIHLKITHADQRAYKCQLCTRAFKGKAALKRHLQTYHTNIRKVHCPVCSMLFKTNADMMSHQRKHFRTSQPKQRVEAVANEHQCSRCDKIFPKLMALVNHERQVHHVRGTGVTYMCTMCEKSYSTKNYLLNHIRQMHLPRRYKCHQCLYEFPYSYMLKKHLPKCKGYPIISKPYRCTRCNRYFNLKGNLTRHMRTIGRCHRAIRNYADYIVMVKSTDEDACSLEEKTGQEEVTLEALQASEALQQLQTSGTAQHIDQSVTETDIHGQELNQNNVQFIDDNQVVLDHKFDKIKQEEDVEEENLQDSLPAFEQLKNLISLPKGLQAMNIKKDADGNVVIEVAGQEVVDSTEDSQIVIENQNILDATQENAESLQNEMGTDQQLVQTSSTEIVLHGMPAFQEAPAETGSESQLQPVGVGASQYSLHQDFYQIGPDGTLQQLVHSNVIQTDDIQIIHDASMPVIQGGETLKVIHSEDGDIHVVEEMYSDATGPVIIKDKVVENV